MAQLAISQYSGSGRTGFSLCLSLLCTVYQAQPSSSWILFLTLCAPAFILNACMFSWHWYVPGNCFIFSTISSISQLYELFLYSPITQDVLPLLILMKLHLLYYLLCTEHLSLSFTCLTFISLTGGCRLCSVLVLSVCNSGQVINSLYHSVLWYLQ